jgi:hypothetical protein
MGLLSGELNCTTKQFEAAITQLMTAFLAQRSLLAKVKLDIAIN